MKKWRVDRIVPGVLLASALTLTGCSTLGGPAADVGLAGAGSVAGYHLADHKIGGAAVKLSLDEDVALSSARAPDLVALDEALESLCVIDQRKSRVVELRFFGGLSVEETAEVLDVSPQTVLRDWKLAKAWLYQEIRGRAHDA